MYNLVRPVGILPRSFLLFRFADSLHAVNSSLILIIILLFFISLFIIYMRINSLRQRIQRLPSPRPRLRRPRCIRRAIPIIRSALRCLAKGYFRGGLDRRSGLLSGRCLNRVEVRILVLFCGGILIRNQVFRRLVRLEQLRGWELFSVYTTCGILSAILKLLAFLIPFFLEIRFQFMVFLQLSLNFLLFYRIGVEGEIIKNA